MTRKQNKLPSIEGRPTALAWSMALTLTFNPLQEMAMIYWHEKKIKVNGHLVQKTEWKQTDEQTDGGECLTLLANVMGRLAIQ